MFGWYLWEGCAFLKGNGIGMDGGRQTGGEQEGLLEEEEGKTAVSTHERKIINILF